MIAALSFERGLIMYSALIFFFASEVLTNALDLALDSKLDTPGINTFTSLGVGALGAAGAAWWLRRT